MRERGGGAVGGGNPGLWVWVRGSFQTDWARGLAMRVTDRHLALLRWLNGYGAVTTRQVAEWLDVDYSTGASIVRRLIEEGLLHRVSLRLFSASPLLPTANGCMRATDSLPPLKGIRAATWPHDNSLVDLAPKLVRNFGGVIEPERRVRLRRRLNGEVHKHTPDLVVHRSARRPFAVELELSLKAPSRIKAIVDYYLSSEFERVLYLTGDPNIARFIQRFVQPFDMFVVKVYRSAASALVTAASVEAAKSEGG